MRRWFAHSSILSDILCGILSSILSVPIIALLKFLRDSLSFSILCIVFLFCCFFFFVSLKFIATRKTLDKTLANYAKTSQEIKAIYPNKDSFMQVLIAILPKAHKVDILDLRGFIFTQQDSPLFSILSSSLGTDYRILLSDPDSMNTEYRAKCMPNKPLNALKNEIQASINVIEGLKKSNIRLRTYWSYNVLRLIFIDGELFLTPFREGDFLSSAPTFRIPANGALFKCYETLFEEIWASQSEQAVGR